MSRKQNSTPRYDKVALPDGTVKRISKKTKGAVLQTGGRPTADIERDFESGRRMRVALSGRVDADANWFEFLGIEPENIVEKCESKSPATKEYLRLWGSRLLSKGPSATGEAAKFSKTRTEATRAAYEEYLNTDAKRGAWDVYNNCRLNHRESSLPVRHREMCEDRVCNPYPIMNEESLEALRAAGVLTEEQDRQISSCVRDGNLCDPSRSGNSQYELNQFTHLPNTGVGDCLFVAFAHYMHIVESLGGVFPDPSADNTGLGRPDVIPYAEQTSRGLSRIAMGYRQDTVRWFADHLEDVVMRYPLKQDLAILALEQVSSVVPASVKASILANFIKRYPNEGRFFKDMTPSSVLGILENIDGFLMAYPEAEEGLNMLINAYANAYIESMSKVQTYGGQAEIVALSRIHNVNIVVLQKTQGRSGVLVQNFGAMVRNPRGIVYIYYLRQAGKASVGSLHYEVMFPLKNIGPAPEPAAPVKVKVAVNAPRVLPKLPQPPITEIPKEDQGLFRTIGITSPLTLETIEQYLTALSGENVLRVINILLSRKMAAVDNLSDPVKKVVYKFIPLGIGKLTDHQRLDILPILPILSIRNADPNNIDDLVNKRDDILYNLFVYYVHDANKKPLGAMRDMLNTPMIRKLSLGARLRTVLNNYLGTAEEELDSASLQELYDIVDSLEESEEATRVKDYFAMEFVESFYVPSLSIILLISNYRGKLDIPGVNGNPFTSVKKLITFFEEYVDLNDAN